ncbi:MFS transporter, partial [bacterium]|nr:MFS transporter [bacterium]
PLVALIVQPTPESMGLLPDGDVQETTVAGKTTPLASGPAVNLEIPLPLAVRTPAFWLISFSFMMAGACLFGMLAHQTSYIESIGISRETASLALGFTAGMGIMGKILLGFLAERISVRFASLVCFGLQFVGVGILMMTHTMFLVWVYAIVFGFSMGGLVTLRTLIVIDFFGSAAIGAILGITSLIFAMGAAFGPLYAAYVFDFTQSYYWAFLIYMAMYVIAMGMLFTARKVKAGVLPALANPAIPAEKSA